MFESTRSVLELDGKQLGAMDGILNRVLGDETVTIWLDTYRGLGFEELLRREATPRATADQRGRGAAMKWWTSNEKRTVLAVRFHRDRSVLWPQLANASFKRLQGRTAT